MIIDDLPAITPPIQPTDEIPIERGTTTYKAELNNMVIGAKGNAENSYRTGNVNLTPANIGAVDKTGDTMTGSLTTAGVAVYDSVFPSIAFEDASFSERAHIRVGAVDNGIAFRLYSPNAATYGTAFEDYVLPSPTAEAGAVYDILTCKAPVSVEQGGTGARVPAAARVNLGILAGSVSLAFNNGISVLPFSTFGLSSRPGCIIITPSSANVLIRYDIEASINDIVLYGYLLDGSPANGAVLVSMLIIA